MLLLITSQIEMALSIMFRSFHRGEGRECWLLVMILFALTFRQKERISTQLPMN